MRFTAEIEETCPGTWVKTRWGGANYRLARASLGVARIPFLQQGTAELINIGEQEMSRHPGGGGENGQMGSSTGGHKQQSSCPLMGTMRGDLEENQKVRWSLLLWQHL